jgi:hypothetical protein
MNTREMNALVAGHLVGEIVQGGTSDGRPGAERILKQIGKENKRVSLGDDFPP